jgi:hypothetical protein
MTFGPICAGQPYKENNVRYYFNYVVIPLCLSFIAIGICFMIGNFVDNLRCIAKWQDSGYESSYSFFGGCKIRVGGRIIPENRFINIKEIVGN